MISKMSYNFKIPWLWLYIALRGWKDQHFISESFPCYDSLSLLFI